MRNGRPAGLLPIFQPLKRTRAHGGVGDGGYAGVEKKKVARGRIGMEMGACMDVAGLGWSDGSFVWPCMAMQAWV